MRLNSLLTIGSIYLLPIALQTNIAHAQLGAHVHGLADLTLAVDTQIIESEFRSPAFNLVGFEHKAITEQELKAVDHAKTLLENHESLYQFSGTQCTNDSVAIDVSALTRDQANHQETGHDDHQHHDDHKHENHQHHKDEHDGHNHDSHEGDHSEIVARYRFKCENTANLKSISIQFFDHFSGIESINTMWVSETDQGSMMLNKDSNTIPLR